MAKSISRFFSDLGLPLRNIRWSWGATAGSTLLLRTWSDEFSRDEGVRRVTVLREPAGYRAGDSYGLDERYRQLEAVWAGGVAAYTIMATVKDPAVRPREIKEYRDDGVFCIDRLEMRPDGKLAAVLGDFVPLREMAAHAQTFRTAAGDGPFPADPAMKTGVSTDAFQLKIPAMRALFEEVCRSNGTLTYTEVMERFGLTFYPLTSALGRLGHDCKREDEPIITAIVVDAKTRRCSDGILKEFGVFDDEGERQKCYAYWGGEPVPAATSSTAVPAASPDPKREPESEPQPEASPANDFEQRASRFAQVEVRTQQAAFRLAVFRACEGRCIVSGCDVPEALEAAHLTGRAWREGQNSAEDGVLLRRDLHTLYDRGLLVIGEDGRVELDVRVRQHYGELQGALTNHPHLSALAESAAK
ncbi:HNH endonuclease [Roseateles sp. MS654]|uniref:HNH endonuclease n=1 Tax=Roseateles sp. MS654 TaxID=3412685 RepID=UPI003C2E3E18